MFGFFYSDAIKLIGRYNTIDQYLLLDEKIIKLKFVVIKNENRHNKINYKNYQNYSDYNIYFKA